MSSQRMRPVLLVGTSCIRRWMLAKNGGKRREGRRTCAIKMERRRVGKWADCYESRFTRSRWTGRSQVKRDTSLLCEKGKALSWPCVTGITRVAFAALQTCYRGDVNAIPVSAVSSSPGAARFRHRVSGLPLALVPRVIFYWLK